MTNFRLDSRLGVMTNQCYVQKQGLRSLVAFITKTQQKLTYLTTRLIAKYCMYSTKKILGTARENGGFHKTGFSQHMKQEERREKGTLKLTFQIKECLLFLCFYLVGLFLLSFVYFCKMYLCLYLPFLPTQGHFIFKNEVWK